MERSTVPALLAALLMAAPLAAPAAGSAPQASQAVGAFHAVCGAAGCVVAELRGEGSCHRWLVTPGKGAVPPCAVRYELHVQADPGVGCYRAEIVGVDSVWPYETGGTRCAPFSTGLAGEYYHAFWSVPTQPLTVLTSARVCVPTSAGDERCETFTHALPLAPGAGCGAGCAPADDARRRAHALAQEPKPRLAGTPLEAEPAGMASACDATACAWLRARHEVVACDATTATGFPCQARWLLDVAGADSGPACHDVRVTGVPGWSQFCTSGVLPEQSTLGPILGTVETPLDEAEPAQEMDRAELWATVCTEGACTTFIAGVLDPRP